MESTPEASRQSGDDRKRAGLEPETFQKRLIAVTAIVLTLGVFGGTCLGSKIERAERIQAESPAGQGAESPDPSESGR